MGTTTLLVVLYCVLPVGHATNASTMVALGAGLVLFTAVLVWQIRSIVRGDHPYVRAAEALAIVIPLLVFTFALVYLGLWHTNHHSFSETIDRTSAVYFTVSVLSTVGFGDIVATTDSARLVVTVQMLLDLVLIGVIARVIWGAARVGKARKNAGPAEP